MINSNLLSKANRMITENKALSDQELLHSLYAPEMDRNLRSYRKQFDGTEAYIKFFGWFNLLVSILLCLSMLTVIYETVITGEPLLEIFLQILIMIAIIGIHFFIGFGLISLDKRVKTPAIILAVIYTVFFTLAGGIFGLIIVGGFSLWLIILLNGSNAAKVFSDEYQEIVARTGGNRVRDFLVKHKFPILVAIFLLPVVLIFFSPEV